MDLKEIIEKLNRRYYQENPSWDKNMKPIWIMEELTKLGVKGHAKKHIQDLENE